MSIKTLQSQKVETFTVTVDLIRSYAIYTLNIDGHITSWNEGATIITGWDKAEVIGRHYSLLYTTQDVQDGLPLIDLQLAANKGSYENETHRVRKDGHVLLADVTLSLIHDEKTGKPVGYIEVIKDVTARRKSETDQKDANALLRKEIIKRKAIEKALKASNAELESFASAASHDLQEPLRMVISYLQLIERRYRQKLDRDGKEFLEFAVDGATRMRTLISDLVEYARIDTVAKPYRMTDLNQVLQAVLSNISVAAKESRVKITYDKLPEVWGDEVQLNQLFQNLIANAIKFSDKSVATIHIGVESKDEEYIFSIKDNGKGIQKKDFDRIFHIFTQLGSRRDRVGSGIGLAIAKKIVNRQYGKIWLESTQGEGTTFYFSIPTAIKYKAKEIRHA